MTYIDQVRREIANLLATVPELAEDEILREDMVEGSTAAKDFLRALERRRQEAACLAGAIAENIAELSARQERFERREKAMRALMMTVLNAADLRKMELGEATLSIRAVPPKVVITREEDLPDIACRFVRKPDMAKIKELLTDDTKSCAGAILSNGGETLSIRTR